MKFVRRNSLVIILLAGLLLCQRGSVGAQMQQTDDHSYMDTDESGGAAGEPAEVQMARAMAAGPRHVTDFARIVGVDEQPHRGYAGWASGSSCSWTASAANSSAARMSARSTYG